MADKKNEESVVHVHIECMYELEYMLMLGQHNKVAKTNVISVFTF